MESRNLMEYTEFGKNKTEFEEKKIFHRALKFNFLLTFLIVVNVRVNFTISINKHMLFV